MIQKFIMMGIQCYAHKCDYFNEWVVWSSLPNHKTYYHKNKDLALTSLSRDITNFNTCS